MELEPYLSGIREQLVVVSEADGPEAQALAARLAAAFEPAVRLAMLDVLSAAAAEITAEISPGSVEVRLRGREPELVVTAPVAGSTEPDPEPEQRPYLVADDSATARINLRLPQDLKDRVEEAARAGGVSVNTWLVRALAAVVSRGPIGDPGRTPTGAGRQSFNGWVR